MAKVKSVLDTADGISQWSIDTSNPDKPLTVETDSLTDDEVIAMVASKGFKAEKI